MKINAEPLLLYIMYLNSALKKWDHDLVLHRSPIPLVKFQQHKRTLCSSRTNTTPVTYSQQTNEDQYRTYVHTRASLRPQTALITNNIIWCKHTRSNATNVRAVCSEPRHTTPVTSEEDQHRAVITISMYLNSAWGWDYDSMLRQRRHCSVYEYGCDTIATS